MSNHVQSSSVKHRNAGLTKEMRVLLIQHVLRKKCKIVLMNSLSWQSNEMISACLSESFKISERAFFTLIRLLMR